MAQEVEDLFKSELKEVFFTPFRVENGTKMSASGKLVDRFYYVKRVMRDQGILASNMKRKKKVEPLTVEVLGKYLLLYCLKFQHSLHSLIKIKLINFCKYRQNNGK